MKTDPRTKIDITLGHATVMRNSLLFNFGFFREIVTHLHDYAGVAQHFVSFRLVADFTARGAGENLGVANRIEARRAEPKAPQA